MLRALPHILSRVFGPPLLIAPVPLDALLVGLRSAMLARGSQLNEPPEIRAFDDNSPSKGNDRPYGYSIKNGVATVPIHGVLVRRAGQVQPNSTILQIYEEVARIMAAAQADNRARGILLDIARPAAKPVASSISPRDPPSRPGQTDLGDGQ